MVTFISKIPKWGDIQLWHLNRFLQCVFYVFLCKQKFISSWNALSVVLPFNCLTLWHHATSPCHICMIYAKHLVWHVKILFRTAAQLLLGMLAQACVCADQSEEIGYSVVWSFKRQELKQSVSDRSYIIWAETEGEDTSDIQCTNSPSYPWYDMVQYVRTCHLSNSYSKQVEGSISPEKPLIAALS